MTCKDCFHYEACGGMIEFMGLVGKGVLDNADKLCNCFKDKSRFVELPCKIGDTVWCIRNFHGHKHPQEGIVSEMLFTKEMKLLIRVKYVGCGHWGKKIFSTQEEAEAAINKKEKNHEDNRC